MEVCKNIQCLDFDNFFTDNCGRGHSASCNEPGGPSGSGVPVERVVMSRLITRIYNSGYMAGHNDTVEACFTYIYQQDMDTYQEDIVEELLNELQGS